MVKLGIRSKFIGILVIAAILPLSIAIIAIYVLGYQYYRKERGLLFQAAANNRAANLSLLLRDETGRLERFITLTDIDGHLRESTGPVPPDPEDLRVQIERWEMRWPRYAATDPDIRSFFTNSLARDLRTFQTLNPSFVELIATDSKGRLVAATGKTTDYWQADENWWQQAYRADARQVHVEGIAFDESAGKFSVDVALPIRDHDQPGEPPLGVIKGVIDARPLFSFGPQVVTQGSPRRQLVQADGTVLFDLSHTEIQPLSQRLDDAMVALIRSDRPGWKLVKGRGVPASLIGYAPVQLSSTESRELDIRGLNPLYVVVQDDASTVLAPMRKQLALVAVAGAFLAGAFSLAGLHIARRKIIRPIQLLRTVAQNVSASAKLDDAQAVASATAAPGSAELLAGISQIKTSDEIEELADEIRSMAARVLTYHEQLEEEIATKTTEIQRDLQFAREFQEALMPRSYPQFASGRGDAALSLAFHHIYKPASSVGGDFFDVIKLSDHRAGIFISDVMGHGARSALVTAILRTLLQDLAPHANDPARFLALVNQHFHDIIQSGNQFLFVSAFFLVIDLDQQLATFASAGHPSPILADRGHSRATPVIEHLENNPALGLFRDTTYTRFTRFLKPNDVFLLYTDGVIEARNAAGEEFGRDRLRKIVQNNIESSAVRLTETVMEAVNEFAGTTTFADDLCLLAVEVTAKKPGHTHAPRPEATVES